MLGRSLAATLLLVVASVGILPAGMEWIDRRCTEHTKLLHPCVCSVTESIAVDPNEMVMCHTGFQCELDGTLIQERHGDDYVRAEDCCTSLGGFSLRIASNGEAGGQCLRCLSMNMHSSCWFSRGYEIEFMFVPYSCWVSSVAADNWREWL